jgi:hypothetical protein
VNVGGPLETDLPDGPWRLLVDSEEARFGGARDMPVDARRLRCDAPCALLFES